MFDLIVVGAGIVGTFHAYFAAKKGLKVVLIEKDQRPRQATVRNFGQVVPSGMSSSWFQFALRGVEVYRQIQNKFDISIRNNGSVYIASNESEQQLIYELHHVMQQRDYPSVLMSQSECIKKWPALKTDYCKEAIFFPTELSAEPEFLIHRLLEFMIRTEQNFTYLPATTVVACETTTTGTKVFTNRQIQYEAKKTVVCNGGEFRLLFPEMFAKSGIVMSKLQMMRTQALPTVNLDGNILTGLTIRRYESFQELPSFKSMKTPDELTELKKWGIHILFKQAIDRSIIIGDSHEYASVTESDDLGFMQNEYINQLMLAEAQRIVAFDVLQIAQTWSGFYPQHPQKDIVEIDIEENIHIRTAIGGKGMTSGAGYAEASLNKIFNR
ncbi:MAG: TIGR03364 family FAD-dependent oxidoreductase [Flammeovirgaceae bacterium]